MSRQISSEKGQLPKPSVSVRNPQKGSSNFWARIISCGPEASSYHADKSCYIECRRLAYEYLSEQVGIEFNGDAFQRQIKLSRWHTIFISRPQKRNTLPPNQSQ